MSTKPLQKAMDFLPKDQKDLKEKSYWKHFFEQDRFAEGFEWYASFEDLMHYLKQHVKEGQQVLVPGCGNSDLSQKILTNLGVNGLTVESIDFEDAVVEKMEASKPKDLRLTYKVGDVTDLKNYQDSQFDSAVDKGTLDAIAVDNDEKTVKMCHAYFNEMMRVLHNKQGTLMIVSLLQPHVLKIVLDFFIKGENNKYAASTLFTVKIQKIEHIEGYAEKQFIKYFVSVTKNPVDVNDPKAVETKNKVQNSVGLQEGVHHPLQLLPFDQAVEKIKVDQQIYMIAPTLKELTGEKDIQMHCFDYSSTNQNVPKYTINIVDTRDEGLLKKRNCAAIIIPQGRESESVFNTEMGRQNLCAQAEVSRLVVIFLGHGHKFDSLKEVQDELNAKILDLAPGGCSNINHIPIMTAGEDIGSKTIFDHGVEGMIVQDLKSASGTVLRQVIFESKYDQIQSEIQIVYRDPKKHEIQDY